MRACSPSAPAFSELPLLLRALPGRRLATTSGNREPLLGETHGSPYPGVWGGTACVVLPGVAFLGVDASSMGSMVICLDVLGGWPPGRDELASLTEYSREEASPEREARSGGRVR